MPRFTKSQVEILQLILADKPVPVKGKFKRPSSYHANAIERLVNDEVIYRGTDDKLYIKDPAYIQQFVKAD